MIRVKFIDYKSKSILFADYSNLSIGEIISLMSQVKDVVIKQPEKSLLMLTDLTNSKIASSELIEPSKDYMNHNKPYVKASALIGFNPLNRVVLNSLIRFSGRQILFFDSKEKALDWLIEQK